ncbi:MAG: GNAT family N-acetyltransferase [Clostridia bacterium]|nr:GNAT family N-acetyltransferase [Clostridia bacterium]
MNELFIRPAVTEDLPEIRDIYARARAFMRESGNPNQWKNTTPTEAQILGDLSGENLFVLTDTAGIAGVFALFTQPDPTYARIDGAWPNDLPYVTIHRIASAGRRGGIVAAAVDFARTKGARMRIDTHADNRVMQSALAKLGFVHCGTIYLENGEPRLAYQLDF